MLCDIHCHVGHGMKAEDVKRYFSGLKEANKVDKICLLSIPVSKSGPVYRLQNLRALQIKDMLYPYAFAFMGFFHGECREDYLTQLKKGLAQGFEGLKVLETKPDIQKDYGIRMCSPEFDEAFEFAEENSVPVLMHVADPEESWNIETVNKWALEHGRFYGLPGFMSREELYQDVESILEKHPKLKLTLAHFYFLSAELNRAFQMFEKHPTVSFDLTPGKEMYGNFGKDLEKAKDFFIKYADRLYFGTDVSDSEVPKYHSDLYELVSRALSDTEPFTWRDYECTPLGLPSDVQEKIKGGNFIKLLGDTPKPVNYEVVKAEIALIESQKATLSKADVHELEAVKAYFYSEK